MNKWVVWGLVVSLVPSIAASKPGDVGCVVEEFRTLTMTIHNPTERLAAATQWLRVHGDACSGKDIALLKSASGGWLGTANAPSIQQLLDTFYNARAKADVAPAAAPAAAPATEKTKSVVSATSEKGASTAAKASADATATNDMANAALASAMTTAAASKAASSLSKNK